MQKFSDIEWNFLTSIMCFRTLASLLPSTHLMSTESIQPWKQHRAFKGIEIWSDWNWILAGGRSSVGGHIGRFKHARPRTVVLLEKPYALQTVQVLTCKYGDVQLQHEDVGLKNIKNCTKFQSLMWILTFSNEIKWKDHKSWELRSGKTGIHQNKVRH